MTRRQFAERFLDGIRAPITRRNIAVCLAIIQAEGDSARCNPWNTTQKAPGSTPLPGNTAGVQEYPDFKTGIQATIDTLEKGCAMEGDPYRYRAIRARLRANAGAAGTLRAWQASAWGTGTLALACLPQTYLRFKHYSNLELRS